MNLEICDYVNQKQGSAPREAAIVVVKLISQRDPQILELAIALLDNLVKNCGYPFHLQILRKEFLNGLVKRFPERPPPRYTKVQRLILGQIEEWYQTICRTSKYKNDFVYIKDMHRLLLNKGYIFPEVKLEDAAVLNPLDNLKLLEQIQQEEAIVHLAKLQELIRRGKPQDLQEANKLMKIMAGFKDDNVVELKKQVSQDVAKLKRKTEILAEMLALIELTGQGITSDHDTVHELYALIKLSQPSILKIVEENDDADQVQELLALNDKVNSVVQKFQLLRGGNVEAAQLINVGGGSQNLIDFDDDDTSAPISNDEKDKQGYNDLLSELADLSFGGAAAAPRTTNPLDLYGSGGIALGSSSATPVPVAPVAANASLDIFGMSSPSPQLESNPVPPANNQLDPFGLDFPQATPAQVLGQSFRQTIAVSQSGALKIEVGVLPQSNASHFSGRVLLSNTGLAPIDQIKFMIAVPKLCKLNLQPQLADRIAAFTNNGATQDFSIENPQNKALKIKWKAEFSVNGQASEELGVSVLE